MGASSSKYPTYPFPVPTVSSDGMPPHWPQEKTKKGKEKAYQPYQQFANGFPTTTYYYPQVHYAPVAMVPIQQPMVNMPQTYFQVAAVQNAAPAAPPVIPATAVHQLRMPEPFTDFQADSAPVIPGVTVARPPTRMPMPEPLANYPVIPDSAARSDPIVPPPPIITDTPRVANSQSRPRFTNFYRPADPPISMPEPHVTDVPYRPPTAPPFQTSSLRNRNPLPAPPKDVWETTPYRQVLQELPKDITISLDVENMLDMENVLAQPTRSTSRLGSIFSSSKRNGKSRKGLFRAFSTSGNESDSGRRHHRSNTVTSFVIPATQAMPYPTAAGMHPGAAPPQAMPAPDRGPPIKFDHTGELSGFVNHSPHRVLFKNKMYPTAMHLLEAMKFTDRPELQERIRKCTDVGDMYPLSASFQEHVRPDWGQVFLKTMEDVLYIKFKQHPKLRTLLLNTGLSDVVYADFNSYWGEGPSGEGSNELGKALMHVRDRLRMEEER